MQYLNNDSGRPMCSEMDTGHESAPRRTSRNTSAVAARGRFSARGRSADKERGAAIVEFALVAVVLFVIIFGLIEGGLLVRARNAVRSAADEGARRGSIAASQETADWQILQQLRVRGALSSSRINYVVVFAAEDSTATPNATCLAGIPMADVCNVYEREEFELPSSSFGCIDANLDSNWCPTDRAQDSAGFEYIGVYINASYKGLTGVFRFIDRDPDDEIDGDVGLESVSVLPFEGSGGI